MVGVAARGVFDQAREVLRVDADLLFGVVPRDPVNRVEPKAVLAELPIEDHEPQAVPCRSTRSVGHYKERAGALFRKEVRG